jgi:hypothetical protein
VSGTAPRGRRDICAEAHATHLLLAVDEPGIDPGLRQNVGKVTLADSPSRVIQVIFAPQFCHFSSDVDTDREGVLQVSSLRTLAVARHCIGNCRCGRR